MAYLATRRPVNSLFNLHNQLGRVFGDLLSSNDSESTEENSSWIPTVDISENDSGFEIHAELPGVAQEDVQVSVTDNLLTIKGEKNQKRETENKSYHRVERRYGTFQRSFTLPRHVDTGNIKGDYKDGILTLTIPKAEAAKPKEIQIGVQSANGSSDES